MKMFVVLSICWVWQIGAVFAEMISDKTRQFPSHHQGFLTTRGVRRTLKTGEKNRTQSSSKSSGGRPPSQHDCNSFYEWSNFIGELGGYNYTGSYQQESNIGSFNTPLFDGPALDGKPVGRLLGSYLVDTVANFATFTAAAYFVDHGDYLVFYMAFPTRFGDGVGLSLGGTGRWTADASHNIVNKPVIATETQLVIQYTLCPGSH